MGLLRIANLRRASMMVITVPLDIAVGALVWRMAFMAVVEVGVDRDIQVVPAAELASKGPSLAVVLDNERDVLGGAFVALQLKPPGARGSGHLVAKRNGGEKDL